MTTSNEVQPAFARRRGRWSAAVIIVLAVVTSSMSPTASPSAAAAAPGLEVLGTLEFPADQPPVVLAKSIVGMDAAAQRLYVAVTTDNGIPIRIAEFDMSTEVPTFVRMSEPNIVTANVLTPNTVLIDPSRNRALVLGAGTLDGGGRRVIDVIDLRTLERVDTWDAAVKMPGFVPTGMTYDERLDRIYLVGDLDGSGLATEVFSLAGTAQGKAAVVAVEGGSGDLVWVARPPSCDTPLRAGQAGATVRLSDQRPLLYFFCRAGNTAAQSTGQGGLLRMDIADSSDAGGLVEFPTEFFPVSGNYSSGNFSTGVAGFDPVQERFFVHSLSSQTHGAWVFDGQRSSWIGFVAAPDDTNKLFGLDSATGKHYMAGGNAQGQRPSGYINVTDGRATPVPQGRLVDDMTVHHRPTGSATMLVPWGDIAADPATQRLFVPYAIPTADLVDGASDQGFAVLRDTLPTITPRQPLDLDELTNDLSDDEAQLEFSANTSGFGAQYVAVGGWENVYTRPTVPLFEGLSPSTVEPNPAQIRYGNRGATTSLVEQVGIASSGSSATAIATRPDDNTPSDAETKTNQVTDPVGGPPSAGDDSEETEETEYATCLDGIGDTVTEEKGSEAEPAHAAVVCDLAKMTTTAHARFSGGSGGGGAIVSDSSFDGRTFRDPKRGVVTETEAIAEGIFFGEPDVGGFGIDRVTSTATTWAKGLDDESHVRWERTVEGARTFAADGTASEPQSCTTIVESGKEAVEQGDCDSLEKELNELVPNRFEVRFPVPEVVATPGGAFASIQEAEADFLRGQATYNDPRRVVSGMEMTVFADGSQRGRLWVQLAAVKADATFIRSPIQTFEPFEPVDPSTGDGDGVRATSDDSAAGSSADGDGGALAFGGAPATSETAPPAPEVAVDDDQGLILASHEQRLVGGFGWLPALRSFGDAVLTGALYLVFLFPVAEIVRRRRLLGVLTDGGPADESFLSVSRSPVRSTS